MAEIILNSLPEKRALKATKFESFGVNLSEVKRTTAELLSQIGKEGIFSEYTKHDISHIDEVLSLASWLVDEQTKDVMSDADWFLITLSIYFHDMGMLVTRDEFSNRASTAFPDFSDELLSQGPKAPEYRARVFELAREERDKFLYQEFVRYNHAKRIRHWIDGKFDPVYGIATSAFTEVSRVLSGLDPTLRRDLGLIAESHHLNDLDDVNKYKIIQPYGGSDAETANVQYCSIVLRSADLLHMRRDRTPTVLFKTINPVDPVSQQEWAKQNAVRRVMPRNGLNEDGIPDDKAPKDTIEVHARFDNEDGFFGLTSFLSYAASEIRQCHEWAEQSKKINASKHSFIWKKIADDKIETEGFLKETFSFDLDQQKILDLLIGHTLYNDTGVVIRELAQNGLDAIRLQEEVDGRCAEGAGQGRLEVIWDSKAMVLSVIDNGTGMTQEIIEKHLLKVGSSRYQDQKFRDSHPNFSAISRFGIGVLSTFMVSDDVEITTCSPDDPYARKISLRSVHGRYLVRLLDKSTDPEARALAPHGTRVKLKIRSTAKIAPIMPLMRQWVVLPRCNVTVKVDNEPAVEIGYKSPEHALKSYLIENGLNIEGEDAEYKVISRKAEGIEFAYAVKWSSYYRDWSMAGVLEQSFGPIPCTCVEGVAVVFATPGMNNRSLIVIANSTGLSSPKTNVARSTLEDTPERETLFSKVYSMYIEHVKEEILRLMKEEGFSLTWAVNNAVSLVPLAIQGGQGVDAIAPNSLREKLKDLPIYIVEKGSERKNINFVELQEEDAFWTIDCELVRSAEKLVREATSNSSVNAVVSVLGDRVNAFPDDLVLYNMSVSGALKKSVEQEFEPSEVVVKEGQRRVDIKWRGRTDRWVRVDEIIRKMDGKPQSQRSFRAAQYLDQRYGQVFGRSPRHQYNSRYLWLASNDVIFSGVDNYCGVNSDSRSLLRSDREITRFLLKIASSCEDETSIRRLQLFSTLYSLCAELPTSEVLSFANTQLRLMSTEVGDEYAHGSERFLEALTSCNASLFNTAVWSKRSAEVI